MKSLLILLAVIAAASALRLPVDLKAALAKFELARLKDGGYELADAITEQPDLREAMVDVVPELPYETEGMGEDTPRQLPVQAILEKLGNFHLKEKEYEHEGMADEIPEQPYESEAMADPVPEVAYESENMADPVPEVAYESEGMADVVPEQPYESEAMADPVPEVAYESEGMADAVKEAPRPPIALRPIFGRLNTLGQRQVADAIPELPYENKGIADVAQPYETEGISEDAAPQPPVHVVLEKLGHVLQKEEEYEHESMADPVPELPYESESMADVAHPYETEGMSEDAPSPPVAPWSFLVKIRNPRQQKEEEQQTYESEHMADPVYESNGMADEASSDENENQEESDAVPEPLGDNIMADGGDVAFGRRFAADGFTFEERPLNADGANEIIAIADAVVAAIRQYAAVNGIELHRKFQAEGDF